ncbi:uncharacterized protein DDB_G0279979-like [Homalodisca vitripennis]|uniref:uncharacterized protein DDB_G0279979-like n=1 Tax=Homalodisca vitripennis TaxID=197043 RepID=UPI001EEBBF41|nr:uncharacterized protein DDB_G0279979-like [Homalodisca vitripennis]KAG8297007.1 hypothetical protein J6590_044660 [Homalodisca vitripennis]
MSIIKRHTRQGKTRLKLPRKRVLKNKSTNQYKHRSNKLRIEKHSDETNNTERNLNKENKSSEDVRPPPPVKEKRPKNHLKRPDRDSVSKEHSVEGSSYPLYNSDSSSDDEDAVRQQRKKTHKYIQDINKPAENKNRKEQKRRGHNVINEAKKKPKRRRRQKQN